MYPGLIIKEAIYYPEIDVSRTSMFVQDVAAILQFFVTVNIIE